MNSGIFVRSATSLLVSVSLVATLFAPAIAAAHGVGSTLNFAAAATSATSVALSWTSTSATNPSLTQHDLTIWYCHGVGCTPNVLLFSQSNNFLPIYTGTFNHTGLITGDTYGYKIQEKHGGDVVEETLATAIVIVLNHAPVANDDSYSTNEGVMVSASAPGVISNDTDDDSDPMTATLMGNVSNGTLVFNTDGSFDYTPTASWSGTDSFTYTVSDGSMTSNTATAYIVVSNINDAPVAVADSYSMSEDTTLTVAASGILTNDTDADSNPLTAILESDVNDGTLTLNANGSFTYTPDANWIGLDSFTYKANDGTFNSGTQTVIITVTSANDVPVANALSITTDQNTAVNGQLTGGDADGNTLSFATTTNPSHGALTAFDSVVGTFTYVPDTGYNGADSFNFKVNDGSSDSNVATVSITVNTPTPAPVVPSSGGGSSSGGGNGGGGTISGPLSIGFVTTNSGGGNGGGVVLGTSTDEMLPAGCVAYLSEYLRFGKNNNSESVKKLQIFLNKELSLNMPVTGYFGSMTLMAVNNFQLKHNEMVLKPWVPFGLANDHTATGYVYKTTRHTINLLMCETLNEPAPQLP